MRWSVFAIFAYLALLLDTGLGALWTDPFGLSIGRPDLVLVLLVFIAMWSPGPTVTWAALILGALVDLSAPYFFVNQEESSVLLGPSALGYLAGAAVVLQVRSVLFRQSPLVIPVLVVVAGLFAHLVVMVLLTLRGLPWLHTTPIEGWAASDQVVRRFFMLLYTALIAFPVGSLLRRTEPLWGFPQGHRRKR